MGPRALIDTNILIDLMAGRREAIEVAEQHADRAISIVTYIEAMSGLREHEQQYARTMAEHFNILQLTPAIADEAVHVRRGSKLKLPDAIILATAHVEGRVLLTRNTRDFAPGHLVHVPYTL